MGSPVSPQFLCKCGHPQQDHEDWPRCEVCKCKKYVASEDAYVWENDPRRRVKMAKVSLKTKKKAKAKASAPQNGKVKGLKLKPMSFEADLMGKIKSLRDEKGLVWSEIGEKLKMPSQKAQMAYFFAVVPKSEKVSGTEAEIGKAIVRMRDKEGKSATEVCARVGLTLSSVIALYDRNGGTGWKENKSRPGRKSDGAPPKKSSPKKEKKSDDVSLDLTKHTAAQLQLALEGKTITVKGLSGSTTKVKVVTFAKVGKTKKGGRAVQFTDKDQKTRTIALDAIVNVK